MKDEIKNKIHDLAVMQITSDFEFIKEQSAGETIYGYGIGIVGDITGFFSAANTLESLKRILSKDDDVYSYWLISEWEYEGRNNNKLYEFLATFIYDIEDGNYSSIMKDYENVLIKALKTCDKKGVFGEGKERENIIVYLHYADATNEDIDDLSSEQINPKDKHLLFIERWNDEKDNLTKIIKKRVEALG